MRVSCAVFFVLLASSAFGHMGLAAEKEWPEPPVGVATSATQEHNKAFSQSLPLGDQEDINAAQRGLVARSEDLVILNADGSVAWDLSAYDFITGSAPDTVNPSLWRQGQLNAIHGLYEVVDGIWQVRGYDLAVMTLIRGETGWIVVDPLTTPATAKAGLALANQHLGQRPVSVVLYTHSHADHFGGIWGVVSEEALAEGNISVIGPSGFADEAVSENLLAGNAMIRRSVLQFGSLLSNSPTGHVGTGLGQRVSLGEVGLLPATQELSPEDKTLILDGVEFEFMDAAGTEAPAELVFFLPQFKALSGAEVVSRTFHNLLTPRGAKSRDALRWSQVIDQLLQRYGDRADVLFNSHHWPVWGSDSIQKMLRNQRDRYRHVHDQTLRLANHGLTMHEIGEVLEEPDFVNQDFAVRGYYGTLTHNAKAVYQHYFGWWDGVPANYHPHPPQSESLRYVEAMGGQEAATRQGIAAFDAGDYRWAATLFNHLVFADATDERAKAWLAASYEQMGFQAESGAWRNYYLSAAHELRQGVPRQQSLTSINSDFLKAVPGLELFNALAVRFDPEKFVFAPTIIHFEFPDRSESISLEVSSAVAFPRQGVHGEPSAQLSINRSAFDQLLLGNATLPKLLESGDAQVIGRADVLLGYFGALDQFDPWFEVVLP